MDRPSFDNLEAELSAYLDGELPAERVAAIERRLRSDAQARRLLEELRDVARHLAALPRLPAPPRVAQAVEAALRRRGDAGADDRVIPLRTLRLAASASLLAACILIGVYLVRVDGSAVRLREKSVALDTNGGNESLALQNARGRSDLADRKLAISPRDDWFDARVRPAPEAEARSPFDGLGYPIASRAAGDAALGFGVERDRVALDTRAATGAPAEGLTANLMAGAELVVVVSPQSAAQYDNVVALLRTGIVGGDAERRDQSGIDDARPALLDSLAPPTDQSTALRIGREMSLSVESAEAQRLLQNLATAAPQGVEFRKFADADAPASPLPARTAESADDLAKRAYGADGRLGAPPVGQAPATSKDAPAAAAPSAAPGAAGAPERERADAENSPGDKGAGAAAVEKGVDEQATAGRKERGGGKALPGGRAIGSPPAAKPAPAEATKNDEAADAAREGAKPQAPGAAAGSQPADKSPRGGEALAEMTQAGAKSDALGEKSGFAPEAPGRPVADVRQETRRNETDAGADETLKELERTGAAFKLPVAPSRVLEPFAGRMLDRIRQIEQTVIGSAAEPARIAALRGKGRGANAVGGGVAAAASQPQPSEPAGEGRVTIRIHLLPPKAGDATPAKPPMSDSAPASQPTRQPRDP